MLSNKSYSPANWDGLVRFLDDGRIEMDTNVSSERCARSQAYLADILAKLVA